MNDIARFSRWLLAVVLMTSCGVTWAQWELDATRSTINFVSIKNDSVGEVHSFSSLVGFIGATGNVQVAIDLGSVETLIPIRDERMREMLFETVKFPAAKVTAQVDPVVLAAVAEGGTITTDLPVTVALHGREQTQSMMAVVVGEGDGRLRVFSARPLLVNAADFGLDAGVTALREIAGLQTISNAVPVTLHLLFVPAD